MAYPRSLFWRRLDAPGAEVVLLDDQVGLRAHGTMVAAAPVPLAVHYELHTDELWATALFEATVAGAGFRRTVRLERAAGRWRVTASEQGDLDAALRAAGHPGAGPPGSDDPSRLSRAIDVDLGYSPLTNTLPVRRLGLLDPPAATFGAAQPVEVAWVLVPSLQVVPASQIYAGTAADTIRFTSGSFAADLRVDPAGYVIAYPGLAERAGGPRSG